MDSSKYVAVKKKLNLRPAAWATMSIVLLDTVLFGVSVLLIQSNSVFGSVGSSCLLALIGFHCFGVLHECGHGSTSRNKFFNSILGHLVSPLCLLPYYPWKYIHAEHHRWTGNLDKDPTLRAIKERKQIGRFSRMHQLVWENWIPIGGMKQYTVFWAYPLTLLGREDVKRRTLMECLFSVCWLIAAWTMLLFALPVSVTLYVVLPAIVLYFAIVELVNLPHHSDQPVFSSDAKEGRLSLHEQHRTTRSCFYPRFVSELLFMNFNFHIEHHLFPTMPWHRLRTARNVLKDSLGSEYTEAIGFAWNLESRSKQLDSVLLTERYLEDSDDKTDPQTNRPTVRQSGNNPCTRPEDRNKFWNYYGRFYGAVERLLPHQEMIRDVLALVPDDSRSILDVGCGFGALLASLGGRFPKSKLYGVDLSETMLSKAKDRVGAEFKQADINERLPYDDNRFDCIICTNVLYAVKSLTHAVAELLRVLANGGVAIIATPKVNAKGTTVLKDHLKQVSLIQALWDICVFVPCVLPNLIIERMAQSQQNHFLTRVEVEGLSSNVRIEKDTYSQQNWLFTISKPTSVGE